MVLVSSIHEVGAKSDFCDLYVELTFSATQASPGHTTTLLFINALLHLKSSVMCIKIVGVWSIPLLHDYLDLHLNLDDIPLVRVSRSLMLSNA
jgi:hypothetical protein